VAKLIHDTGMSLGEDHPKTPIATAEHYFDDEIRRTPQKRRHHRRRSSAKLPRRYSIKQQTANPDVKEPAASSAHSAETANDDDEDIAEEIRKALEKQLNAADSELETRWN
jgi:hypothetical protein